jgi:hypothetical protein
LQARGKYLPAIAIAPDKKTHAYWRLLLDSDTDASRLRLFSQMMPLSCRLYHPVTKPEKDSQWGSAFRWRSPLNRSSVPF